MQEYIQNQNILNTKQGYDAFRAYDLRGIYGKDITEDLAYQVGGAFINYLNAKTLVVGHDMRDSSPSLSDALIKGARDAGADVIDIGLASTDMLYFASMSLKTDAAIEITASHNPQAYNGIKFNRESAIPVGLESGLNKVRDIVYSSGFKKASTQGTLRKQDILEEFLSFMKSFINPKDLKPMKVVIDTGNGMGGYIIPKLFKDSPLEIIPLFFELDGNFPNHEANPLVAENRVDLVNKVKETGADLGIGLDGDTDRAFFVDSDGTFADGDLILGLMSKAMLKKEGKGLVVYDVRCSNFVKDTVEKLGGTTAMWKVGHAYAKLYMREHNAVFGGEVSGHYYFKYEGNYFDSGNLTALTMLKMLSDENITLKEALKTTKDYYLSGEINSTVKNPDKKIEELKEIWSKKEDIKLIEIDGISIIAKDWWANIRKSNTEPLLRLNCEAKSKEKLEEIKTQFLDFIRT